MNNAFTIIVTQVARYSSLRYNHHPSANPHELDSVLLIICVRHHLDVMYLQLNN